MGWIEGVFDAKDLHLLAHTCKAQGVSRPLQYRDVIQESISMRSGNASGIEVPNIVIHVILSMC